MARKAAIQMSLGFIVAVVFAVVFLGLAVMWLNNMFPLFTGLTEDLIQQGKEAIEKTFRESDQSLAVYPQNRDVARGGTLKMVAGVQNNEADSAAHSFTVNVIATDPSTESWINRNEFSIPLTAQFRSITYFPITVTPPNDAPKGTYTFYVIGCIDKSWEQCQQPSDQNFESPQYFRITLK
jgi:hypothetical protein